VPATKYISRYTVDDYQQWEGEWELWEGIPIAMTPSPFGKHQRLVARCSHVFIEALDRASCQDCEVFAELDWIISDNTVVRPDLMILCGDIPEAFATSVPKLVVEILSKSTRSRDLTSKFELYEYHGVAFYLVLDPDTQETQMWELIEGNYQSRLHEGTLQLTQDCSIQFTSDNLYR